MHKSCLFHEREKNISKLYQDIWHLQSIVTVITSVTFGRKNSAWEKENKFESFFKMRPRDQVFFVQFSSEAKCRRRPRISIQGTIKRTRRKILIGPGCYFATRGQKHFVVVLFSALLNLASSLTVNEGWYTTAKRFSKWMHFCEKP